MSDIVSVLWAFASLNLTHSELFAEIRQVLHREAENCSPKELTQITWVPRKEDKNRQDQGQQSRVSSLGAPI